MDLFVVPMIGFDLLYAFVIVRIDPGDLVWINVTKNPMAYGGETVSRCSNQFCPTATARLKLAAQTRPYFV